jgi:hypothetical protein
MTFEEVQRLIKKGDLVSLQRELDRGLSPDLANRFSRTLQMLASMKGDVPIG